LSDNFAKTNAAFENWLGKVSRKRKENKRSPKITTVYGG
jgi:hypothetical protein